MSKQMNRPPLRFPEFEGDWEKKKLGALTNWASGGTPPKDNADYWNGDIPWISASSMRGTNYSDSELKITIEGLKKGSKIAKKGSLLILVRGSMLFNKIPIGIATKNVAFNQDVKSIVVDKTTNPTYILQWFISSEPKIMNMVTGTGIGAGKLDLDELKGIELSFPSLPEQTKIASFLTAVDEKIQALKKKHSLLEQYKKGVMQRLFSQDVRFKDENGKDFSEWEVKKLGEVCKIARSGGTPTSTNKSFYNGDIPFLSISDMTSQGKYLTHTSNHISKLGLENSSSWIVPVNSLIYSMYASVGFVAINKIPIATSQAVLNLILKEQYDLEFMYYILVDFQKNIAQFITTGTQGNLNAQSVKNFELKIPSLKEQIEISNFLTSIDEKINQTQTQIEKTEIWKKGLLQKMFV